MEGDRGYGGIYKSPNLGLYGYSHLNPVLYKDPDGNSVFSAADWYDFASDVGGLLVDEIVYTAAVISGNQDVANLAVQGMVEKRFDAMASTAGIISPVPRTGKGIKAAKEGLEQANDVSKAADRTGDVAKKVPNPHGSRGGPAHRDTIDRRVQELKDQGHEHMGGGNLKEELIRTPGGCKSCRRPDITTRAPDGSIYRENVGRSTQSGNPISRERQALDDIEAATGSRPGYTPYDK